MAEVDEMLREIQEANRKHWQEQVKEYRHLVAEDPDFPRKMEEMRRKAAYLNLAKTINDHLWLPDGTVTVEMVKPLYDSLMGGK